MRDSLHSQLKAGVFAVVAALVLAGAFLSVPAVAQSQETAPRPMQERYGVIVSVSGATLILRLRDGRDVSVDAAPARAARASVLLFPTRPVHIEGYAGRDGRFHAVAILKSHIDSRFWPPDR